MKNWTNSKKILNNEDGIALVSALVLGALSMLMVASLLFMVDTGTWLSGSQKRYQMDLDAAHGGMDFFTEEIIQRTVGGTNLSTLGNYGGIVAPKISDINFKTKLTTSGYIGDGTFPSDAVDIVMTYAYPSSPNVNASNSIVNTSRGNSGTSQTVLQGGGVVNNSPGAVNPQHIPYLYQTNSQGQSAINPREKAVLSSVYAY